MEIKAIALTLPNPEKFLVLTLKRSNTPGPLEWDVAYREQLFEMQRFVREVARGLHHDELNDEQREALYVEGLDAKEAEHRIKCVWLDADRYGKNVKFLDKVKDSVTVGGMAGYDVEGGMIRYLLVNKGTGFVPTREFLEVLERSEPQVKHATAKTPGGKEVPLSRYEPGYTVLDRVGNRIDFDDLQWRRNHILIGRSMVFKGQVLADGKVCRYVTLPYEVKVSIVASRGKEVLREVPRQWS